MREPGFFVPPMLAVTAQEPFDDSQWIYEVKWDGYRCQIHWNGTLRLYSRQGHDLLTQFPDLQDAGTFLPFPMVLDAELVAWIDGHPSFAALQRKEPVPHRLIVFDCLFAQTRWVMHEPLATRRALLQERVKSAGPLVVSEAVDGQGLALLHAVREQGLEGVMAKDRHSLYHPGQRVRFWQKFLAEYRQWALVPYVSRRKHHGGWLWAIVSAETQLPLGLLPAPRSWSVPEELQQTSADMVPLKPPLHAEVSYRMLTDTGRMRHGRIRRWRR